MAYCKEAFQCRYKSQRIAELKAVVERHTDIYAAERQQADEARDERDEALVQIAAEQERAEKAEARSSELEQRLGSLAHKYAVAKVVAEKFIVRPMSTAPRDGTTFLALYYRSPDSYRRPHWEWKEIFWRPFKCPIFHSEMPWHSGDPLDADKSGFADSYGPDCFVAWLPTPEHKECFRAALQTKEGE